MIDHVLVEVSMIGSTGVNVSDIVDPFIKSFENTDGEFAGIIVFPDMSKWQSARPPNGNCIDAVLLGCVKVVLEYYALGR